MNEFFELLKQGLEEAIAYERGEGSATVYTHQDNGSVEIKHTNVNNEQKRDNEPFRS